MSVGKPLWEFLDSGSHTPRLLDTQEEGLDENYFLTDDKSSPIRWKIGLTAGLALMAVVVLLAVAAHLFRQASPVAEALVTPVLLDNSPQVVDQASITANVLVHVVGAVHQPGVIELPENSRVIDALTRAGGATDEADLTGINLARIVYDGEQIVVPRPGDTPPQGAAGSSGGPISLSRADQATLETLPRIGPATAQRIISWREQNGPFRSVEDLLAVSGIGPATLEGIRDRVVP
jgi:competence protein ComEA